MVKGISTYEYILRQREAEQRASEGRTYERRTLRQVCCVCLNRQRKGRRVTPIIDEESSISSGTPQPNNAPRSRSGSGGSVGMANFGRTPPPVSCQVICGAGTVNNVLVGLGKDQGLHLSTHCDCF